MSVSALARKYNIGYGIIYNKLISDGIKKQKHYKLSDEKYNSILQMIQDGYSCKEIKQLVNTDRTTIHTIADENNLTVLKHQRNRNIKNSLFKDDYFSVIDTEAKAYYLGLIYSDGYVRKHHNGYFLGISLKVSDIEIVERLAKELCCNNSIAIRNRETNFGHGSMCEFETCNSKKLFDDLARFDIIPDKSHKSMSFKNIEELIPQHLIRHFLRGLIDGDGSIGYANGQQKYICFYQNSIECCHNFDFLLKKIMNDQTLHENIIVNQNGVYNLRYRRVNDIKKITDFLYRDATFYLKRKYDIAREYFEELVVA